MIDRRQLIKQFFFAGAGIIVLPSCVHSDTKASIVLAHVNVSGEQERMLAELSETILPTTDQPGAKDIAAHLFVLKMVDDCYAHPDQQKFLQGMDLFDKACIAFSGKRFIDCTPVKRVAFVESIDGVATQKPFGQFYNIVKKHTIQAYTTSKFYLDNIIHYKLVPGTYHGCVPIKIPV